MATKGNDAAGDTVNYLSDDGDLTRLEHTGSARNQMQDDDVRGLMPCTCLVFGEGQRWASYGN